MGDARSSFTVDFHPNHFDMGFTVRLDDIETFTADHNARACFTADPTWGARKLVRRA